MNFSYHSASLTFYFILSLFFIFLFITVLVSKVLILNIREVFYILYQLFPEVTERFVQGMFNLSKQPNSLNIIAFILSIYFSKDFFLSLNRAFSYVTEKQNRPRFNLYLMSLSLPFLFTLILFLYLIKVLIQWLVNYFSSLVLYLNVLFGESVTIYLHNLVLKLYSLLFLNYIFEVVILSSFVYSGYFFLLRFEKSMGRDVFIVSLVVSILILLLKRIFEAVTSIVFSKSPLFVIMGSVFIVIMWLRIMFDIILIGARLLFYLEKASSPEA
ncbi:MAG: YihY/virulence factor BrkB family protein [Hydrogenothermaceae bacterium]|nr:YihY/virulence factor BrkB family protein [Hydrogenothermaceae bacterium]